MKLSDRSLGWLRSLDRTQRAPGAEGASTSAATALALALMVQRTPSWTEGYGAALDRFGWRSLLEVAPAWSDPSPVADLLSRALDPWWVEALGDPHRFERAVAAAGLDLDAAPSAVGAPVAAAQGWLVAKEANLTEVAGLLAAAVNEALEPTTDAETGEFRWVDDTRSSPERLRAAALAAAAEAGGPAMVARLQARPLDEVPQIVDVDTAALSLSRAEWQNGCVLLRLEPIVELPRVATTFRLIGAEPRIWCLSGLSGVTTDVTGHSVIVRAPLVRGDLEFTPGSY